MNKLALTYQSLGKYTDAVNLMGKVVDARKKTFGIKHLKTTEAMILLAEIRSQAKGNTSRIESTKEGEFYLL